MCALFLLSGVGAVRATDAGVSHVDPSYLNSLQWRLIGPFRGGRALAVTGVPGEPDHFYFGAVDGGVWESINAGRTWNPIFDDESVGSIGAIAVAPGDTKTLYVGSGEADMRSDIAYGNGMYKSIDGGKTWLHIGLDDTKQIGRVIVDPRDPNTVYVAALGHQYGPNAERGVFKTTDGGKTWTKALYKDENTGAIDLAMDPRDPNVIYASLWQTRRPPWNVYPPSNGPGSGLYKSPDGGKTWTQLTQGLPAKVGHIGLSISNANPSRVYAQVDSDLDDGGIYRSDDAGKTWTHVDGGKDQLRLWQRGWYFGEITADPKNPDIVYVMNTSTYRSTDGGKSFIPIKGAPGGDDYHALWIDPNDSNRMILGSDQGVVVSVDDAKTWSSWYNQPTGQFYHVITDNRFPYWVYGAQQDSGAAAVPSTSHYGSISLKDFRPIDVGGENGYLAPDPLHPGVVYGGSDITTVENTQTGWEQVVDPSLAYPDEIWRHTWTLPLVISPVDKRTIYTSRQQIFRSQDGAHSWTTISPDLTRTGDNHPTNLDPTTLSDNTGLLRRGVVYAIAPSTLDAKLIWAGTDDGNVWVTHDGGAHWQNVTPPQLTAWSKVGIIEASRFDRNTAYLAVDRHRLDDYTPYIYRTRDGGKTWTPMANGIPDGSFVNVVREDPKNCDLLYAGTERGTYVSFDGGDHWQSLQRNLPVTSIRDIEVHGDDLVIATHGRAFWIMDDIEPLREIASISGRNVWMFTPALAYRVRPGNEEGTPYPLDEPQASNRTPGAYIDYYLGTAANPVTIEVLDRNDNVVQKWSSADKPVTIDYRHLDIPADWATPPPLPQARAGANRFIWDFHTKNSNGPLAPPGVYTVRVTANGSTLERYLTVARDPRIRATDADLMAQYNLAVAINGRLKEIAKARGRAETLLQSQRLSSADVALVRDTLLGATASENPDEGETFSNNFVSLTYLHRSFDTLSNAVESADAAPTHDMTVAYAKLSATLQSTLTRLNAIAQR